MELPKKGLLITDLKPVSSDAAVTASAHAVHMMQFQNGTQPQKVFYKPLSEDYTEERAKYVVASSIVLQLSLGESAAKERLVYRCLPSANGELVYKIVGTASFAVPNFKPMCFSDEPIPSDLNERDKTAPSLERLLRAPEIAAIILASQKYDDDDLHPGNLGHASHHTKKEGIYVRIDHDRFCSQGSARSAEGYLLGTAREKKRLKLNFFDNFPNDTGRGHMPSNPASATLKSNKKFPKHDSFSQLASKDTFHRQMMSAALKELLMHRPRLIKQRLEDNIGIDDPFIDSFMTELDAIYQDFYRTTVFYSGCEKNDYGARVPSFNEFLKSTPSAYQAIERYVKEYNTTVEDKDNAAYIINEQELHQHYHQIWRDSKVTTMNELLEKLFLLVEQIKNILPSTSTTLHLKHSNSSLQLAQSQNAVQLMSKYDFNDGVHVLTSPTTNTLHTALKKLTTFTKKLNDILVNYVGSDRETLTDKTNHTVINELNDLMFSANTIKSDLGNGTTYQGTFDALLKNLDAFVLSINLPRHLRAEDTPFYTIEESLSYITPHSYEEKVVVHHCISNLFEWAKELSSSDFNQKIQDIINSDYAPLINGLSARSRHTDILPYVQISQDNPANTLAYILSHGGVEETSLNTCLLKHFIPMMLDATQVSIDPKLQPVREKLSRDAENFNWGYYAKKAQQWACTDKTISHIYHDATFESFNKKIFSWVEAMTPKEFKTCIKDNVFKHYTTYTSRWFGGGRKQDIESMLNDPNSNPNKKVLAAILAKGGQETNSLSTTALRYLFRIIKEQATLDSHSDDPSWQCLRTLDIDSHLEVYKNKVRSFAKEVAAEYEKALVSRLQDDTFTMVNYA